MELKFYVGMLGTTFSLFLQISPIPGMIEGFKKGDIKSMTIGYFITGITQASLWIGYGACLKDFFIYFPNVTCASLFLVFLNMLIYVKKKYHLFYLLNPALILQIIIILSFFPEHLCDTLAAALCLLWQTTNIETIRLAIKYYSKEYINPLLSLVSFLCFFFGSTYSLLIHAYAMLIPNVAGSLINLINIYLYYWAGGYFQKENILVNILTKILRPENAKDENLISNSNIDYNNIDKEEFLNKI